MNVQSKKETLIAVAFKLLQHRRPVLHVDTGKKFTEMYAFRERYAAEWNLDLKVEQCPPVGLHITPDGKVERSSGSLPLPTT
jgi:3'-phosphoadenosine 5'-phosphosulfate sulfotransferase (PAPS reductase)/FAD synthetase